MRKPLVSIHMPVLNGEYFLPSSLKSLLAQDYENLELIVLDNLSTDRTPEICRSFARQDGRLRYIRDTKNRITHEAANHLANHIRGEYWMGACDDDLWEPDYVSRLVAVLEERPEVGMVYSNADYVDLDNNFTRRPILKKSKLYQRSGACFTNAWHYLVSRHVIPIVFGIFRTHLYRRTLPWDNFDETIADVDNLFIFKFLTRYKVHSVDEVLFHYRRKHRWADADGLPNYPKDHNPLAVWRYNLLHQLRFKKKIMEVIDMSPFSEASKAMLRLRAHYALVKYFTADKLRNLLSLRVRKHLAHSSHRADDMDHQGVVRHHALVECRRSEVIK